MQVLGGVAPTWPGEVGEGLDAYTIEAALREHLTDQRTRQELRGVGLVPHALPEGRYHNGDAPTPAAKSSRQTPFG